MKDYLYLRFVNNTPQEVVVYGFYCIDSSNKITVVSEPPDVISAEIGGL